jgi:hypothetical protein
MRGETSIHDGTLKIFKQKNPDFGDKATPHLWGVGLINRKPDYYFVMFCKTTVPDGVLVINHKL